MALSTTPQIDYTTLKGIVGGSINLAAFITSYQEHLEWMLRVTSLGIGITVGILTVVSMVKKIRKPPSDKE